LETDKYCGISVKNNFNEIGMTTKETVQRELKVAFSKNAQPIWFRITKWAIFIGLAYLLYMTKWFWAWVIGVLILSMTGHSIYRWKNQSLDRVLEGVG
jgi:hypothetical protein